MELQAALALLALIQQGAATLKALEGIGEMIRNKVERGETITLDDLKQYSLADDAARDALVKAIDEAEEQG